MAALGSKTGFAKTKSEWAVRTILIERLGLKASQLEYEPHEFRIVWSNGEEGGFRPDWRYGDIYIEVTEGDAARQFIKNRKIEAVRARYGYEVILVNPEFLADIIQDPQLLKAEMDRASALQELRRDDIDEFYAETYDKPYRRPWHRIRRPREEPTSYGPHERPIGFKRRRHSRHRRTTRPLCSAKAARLNPERELKKLERRRCTRLLRRPSSRPRVLLDYRFKAKDRGGRLTRVSPERQGEPIAHWIFVAA